MNSNAYFISWSGGKDSCLALHRANASMGMPQALVTMLIENGQVSRSHGLRREVLKAQSNALGVPIFFHATSWADYETTFAKAMMELRSHGITSGVFGDIKIDGDKDWSSHRSWAENICKQVSMIAHEPLWDSCEADLERDFLASGIQAVIVAANERCLDRKYLGRTLNQELLLDFRSKGVHPLGERGEYHTLVVNSPLFKNVLNVQQGQEVLHDGYWFLDVAIPMEIATK
jgi:diphthine-ammonia ligase